MLTPLHLIHAWITKENVNHLLRQNGAIGEIDLFSLDMDGNDYYIWEELTDITVRLCICEIHNIILGPEHQRYHTRLTSIVATSMANKSLGLSPFSAMTKLSEKKGYRFNRSAAPSTGVTVELSTKREKVATVPSNLTVAAGATTATFKWPPILPRNTSKGHDFWYDCWSD